MNSKFTQDKIYIRENLKRQRAAIHKNKVREDSLKIFQKITSIDWFLKFNSYLLYMSINNEVETEDLIEFLQKKKKNIYLPASNGNRWELRRFKRFQDLERGLFGIKQPKVGSTKVNDVEISILPGIAFLKNGVRVGFGKGVYDRILKNSKSYKIGICYEFQVVDSITPEVADILVDAILTDKNFYLLNNQSVRK